MNVKNLKDLRGQVRKRVQIYKAVGKLNGLFFYLLEMFCRVCRQHKPPVENSPKMRPFVEVGAVPYRKDYMEHHFNTEHHQQSIKCHESIASDDS